MKQLKVLITGGGTGGHIFPAIAIADALKVLRPEVQILFVGAKGKMEMERVPKAGYEIVGLPIAGFQRTLTLQNVMRNIAFPFKLAISMWQARRIVRDFKPNVAVGVGGYASGPVMKAALSQGVATVIQEQNSYAGVTNKLLGDKVDCICVAYDRMEEFFPVKKLLFTGNPVRSDLLQVDKLRSTAYKRFEFAPLKQTILVLGGSLGARSLNAAMRDNTDFFVRNPQLQVIWQCGKYYFDEYANCATAQLPQVKIMAFVAEMDIAYAIADVIIARAGALTISELCLVGKPSILVPSPNVAEDHQTKNALNLVQKNAAILVKDDEASEKMLEEALFILKNNSLAFGLAERIRTLARPNAATTIAEEVIQLGKKNAKKRKNGKA